MVNKRPCLFLDRDGVLIEDVGYPYREDQIHIMPGAPELVKWAHARGYLVVVLSNQAGIAKGLFGVEDYNRFTKALAKKLAGLEAPIDGWYYCPYHPDAKVPEFRKDSDCRKPNPGMYHQAIKDLPIDPSKCLMVGDKDSDVLNGVAMETYLLKGKYELKSSAPVFSDLKKLLAHFKEKYE